MAQAKDPPPRFYTTDVPAQKTAGEILDLLVEHGGEGAKALLPGVE